MTIYRWKPENFKLAVERWTAVAEGRAPKEVLEAMKHITIESQEFCAGQSFIVVIFECKDEDLWAAQTVAFYEGDAFTMETYPVCQLEAHMKAYNEFRKWNPVK
ncbi:MAG: hypothetical protein JW839_17275 [Candidatus Lokiarchaeota archaeon]|nr:hypothetical protein [Candidatus Lokiarchaeota archaeon]